MTSNNQTDVVKEMAPVRAGDSDTRFAGELLGSIGQLLGRFVSPDGHTVDYPGLEACSDYHDYLEKSLDLARFDPAVLEDREHRLAFWINIYNMTVIDRVVKLSINDSVEDDKGFFSREAFQVGSHKYSLDDIENGILRGNARRQYLPLRQFRIGDARIRFPVKPIHECICFALVRGSKSCPILHFYQAEKIEAQLHAAADGFINGGGAVLNRDARTLSISRLFKRHAADFGGGQGVMKFIVNHFSSTEDAAFLRAHASSLKVDYQNCDWGLNISV
ncbi:MAG: DUF547 domain-containing protein [Thermoleophilia bacterium]